MTTILPSSLRQPNRKDYFDALSNEYNWPFRLRARVINTYRKLMRPVAQLDRATLRKALRSKDVGASPTRVTKPRYPKNPKRFKKGASGRKNYITIFPKQPIFVLNNKGKNRPTKVRKIIFRRKRMVLWLKGNKHNGGQHIGFN